MANIFDTLSNLANEQSIMASEATARAPQSNPALGPTMGPYQRPNVSQSLTMPHGFVPLGPDRWGFFNRHGRFAEDVKAPVNPYHKILTGPGQGVRGREWAGMDVSDRAKAMTWGQGVQSPYRPTGQADSGLWDQMKSGASFGVHDMMSNPGRQFDQLIAGLFPAVGGGYFLGKYAG